jgi:hypothetical protein
VVAVTAPAPYTGRVIYACPNLDCDGDLEEDGFELWCPRCKQTVPYAQIDPESDPEF